MKAARPQNKNIKKHEFPKGVSGNPKGKKKGTLSLTTHLKALLKDNPEDIEKINGALVKMAKKGNLGHITMIYDRVDGPSRQKIDVSVYSDAFSKAKKEEMEDIVRLNSRK